MLVALLSVRLADESAGFLIPGSLEAFRSELHLSYAQAATILAAGAPGAIVGNGFAIAADYFSRRVIAVGGALWFAAAVAVFATSTSYVVLVGASFVIGVAASAMVDASELALVDVSGDDLPRMLGASNFLGSIGDLAGPVLIIVAAWLGFGWQAPFLLAALLMAAYGVWLALSPLPPPHRHAEQEAPHRAAGVDRPRPSGVDLRCDGDAAQPPRRALPRVPHRRPPAHRRAVEDRGHRHRAADRRRCDARRARAGAPSPADPAAAASGAPRRRSGHVDRHRTDRAARAPGSACLRLRHHRVLDRAAVSRAPPAARSGGNGVGRGEHDRVRRVRHPDQHRRRRRRAWTAGGHRLLRAWWPWCSRSSSSSTDPFAEPPRS